MVNKEALPDLRTRVNFDASRYKTGELRDQAWQKRYVSCIKGVGNTMVENGPKSLIDERFKDITTGRVFLKNDIDGVRPTCSTAWHVTGCWYRDTWW